MDWLTVLYLNTEYGQSSGLIFQWLIEIEILITPSFVVTVFWIKFHLFFLQAIIINKDVFKLLHHYCSKGDDHLFQYHMQKKDSLQSIKVFT